MSESQFSAFLEQARQIGQSDRSTVDSSCSSITGSSDELHHVWFPQQPDSLGRDHPVNRTSSFPIVHFTHFFLPFQLHLTSLDLTLADTSFDLLKWHNAKTTVRKNVDSGSRQHLLFVRWFIHAYWPVAFKKWLHTAHTGLLISLCFPLSHHTLQWSAFTLFSRGWKHCNAAGLDSWALRFTHNQTHLTRLWFYLCCCITQSHQIQLQPEEFFVTFPWGFVKGYKKSDYTLFLFF